MLEYFVELAKSAINSYGIAGIFVVAVLESFIFPVPTAIIITSATALGFDVLTITIIATIGSVIGAVVGYYLGKKGGRPALVWLFDKKKLKKVDYFFDKYGVWAVGIAALTPIPFKIFTISAGVSRMRIIPFVLICIPTRFLQFLIFAKFGSLFAGFL